jgi:type II restriction enzyme
MHSARPRLSVAERPFFRTDPAAFHISSYTTRYQLLFQRLVHERLYDAAYLISTKRGQGIHDEPVAEASTPEPHRSHH